MSNLHNYIISGYSLKPSNIAKRLSQLNTVRPISLLLPSKIYKPFLLLTSHTHLQTFLENLKPVTFHLRFNQYNLAPITHRLLLSQTLFIKTKFITLYSKDRYKLILRDSNIFLQTPTSLKLIYAPLLLQPNLHNDNKELYNTLPEPLNFICLTLSKLGRDYYDIKSTLNYLNTYYKLNINLTLLST
jgi:hypothetical protein